MPQTNSFDWLDYSFRMLPIFLVVTGWFLVNRQNNNRETRKEIRVAIDKLVTSLSSLTSRARIFHTEKFSSREQLALQSDIQRVSDRADFIAKYLKITISNECIDLRKSITAENFDKTNHIPLDDADELLSNIEDCAYVIEYQLETSYTDQFQK